jgi:EpsD family peptidyl-prolyl cis-trans isomerase
MGTLPLRSGYLIVVLSCCAALLTGCGKKSGDSSVSGGQVIAHIGEQVVTAQEFENELRLANVPPDKQKDPAVTRKVLSDLVVRKYLLQQALAAKLDREPSVLLDILRSREQVLENAFLVRTALSKTPGKAEVDKYIVDNPVKFAKRKLLSAEQIAFPFGASGQSIVDANKNAKSLDDIDQQLTSAGVPHARQMGSLSSGDISPDLYNAIEARNADDVFFVRSGQNGIFFKVRGEEDRPLEGEAAANAARQMMRTDALKAEAGIATYSANLEAKYEGEYANIMKPVGERN